MKKSQFLPQSVLSLAIMSGVTYTAQVHADLRDIAKQLPGTVERQAALAIQDTYEDLIANGGCSDNMRPPLGIGPNGPANTDSVVTYNPNAAGAPQGVGACSGATYALFDNVRALVHTANSLSDSGNSTYSLNLDAKELAGALRWSSGEEYSAEGSTSKNYARAQASRLTARLTALRMGANGFSLNATNNSSSGLAYNSQAITGGGASADRENYSRLSGFINFSSGKAEKNATDLEDAFDSKGNQFTAGLDYRINNNWIAGALISYVDQSVDFDKAKSIVDGNIDTTGYSFSPFALYQQDNFYVSGSLTLQTIQFDSSRAIHYPSNNPMIPAVDTRTVASTDGHNTTYFLGAGYNIQRNQLSIEPFINLHSTTSKIDGFTEIDLKDSALNLNVNSQRLTSADTTLGVTGRYTFTPSYGVVTPYVTLEYVSQSDTKQHTIGSHYANAITQDNTFNLPSDKADKNYIVTTIGVSSVLKGAHQKTVGGSVAGGVQAFAQYKQLSSYKDYSSSEIEVGLRYEF